MLYNNFPTTKYNSKELSNILLRMDFVNRDSFELYTENYYVNDGESPESLAVKFYDDSFYSWVILYINDMFNRELDWPLSGEKLDTYLTQKYNYSSVFVSEPLFIGQILEYNLSEIYAVEYGLIQPKRIKVVSYDRNLNKFNLESKIPENITTNNTELRLIRSDGNTRDIVDLVVHESLQAIHHFEDDSGNIMDSRLDINAYITGSTTTNNMITNSEYELKINDAKRNIRILKPQYAKQFVDSFKSVLKEINARKDIEDGE